MIFSSAFLFYAAEEEADAFDEFAPPGTAGAWRSTVDADQQRQVGIHWRPLSRGYRSGGGEKPPPPRPPLTDQFAWELASNSLRRVAQEVGVDEGDLPLDATNRDDGLGPAYARQLEGAFSSRLASDPDFDPVRFPNAAKRFRSK